MKSLFQSAQVLLLDLASTFVFLLIVLVTKSTTVGIVAGMAFGVGQITVELIRKKPVGVMQWLSLALVIGFGGISLITHDPRFIMVKPTLIYLIVGGVMCKPGWMNRYLPPIAQEIVPDLGFAFGYVWAGLMFLSAVLNLGAVALHLDVVAWAAFMSLWASGSKIALFLVQYAIMRLVAVRRRRAQEAAQAAQPGVPAAA